jgi:hypothetical protein
MKEGESFSQSATMNFSIRAHIHGIIKLKARGV